MGYVKRWPSAGRRTRKQERIRISSVDEKRADSGLVEATNTLDSLVYGISHNNSSARDRRHPQSKVLHHYYQPQRRVLGNGAGGTCAFCLTSFVECPNDIL